MALSRRTGARFQGSIWPGFVDAMTGLLLVLMFVLTIFMVLQAVQTQRINGQENELNSLSGEVAALAQALGMERQTTAELEAELGTLNTSLTAARDQAAEQAVRQARRFPVPGNNSQFERYFRRFYFLFQPEDLLR